MLRFAPAHVLLQARELVFRQLAALEVEQLGKLGLKLVVLANSLLEKVAELGKKGGFVLFRILLGELGQLRDELASDGVLKLRNEL